MKYDAYVVDIKFNGSPIDEAWQLQGENIEAFRKEKDAIDFYNNYKKLTDFKCAVFGAKLFKIKGKV